MNSNDVGTILDEDFDIAVRTGYHCAPYIHGYAVVIKKRNWCAQSLLPVCPEMVFCDAMPNQKYRKGLDWMGDEDRVDTSFDFDKRNFLARGGEVYYLHLLQALEKDPESKDKLEKLLSNLMGGENNKLSKICNVIQNVRRHIVGGVNSTLL